MSCLFDSVVALIKGNSTAEDLRQRCVDFIVSDSIEVHGAKLSDWQKWDSPNESLEQYAARMRSPAEWGGGLELVAIAHLLSVEIAVHLVMPAGGTVCVGEFRDTRCRPDTRLNLLYNGSHYMPSKVEVVGGEGEGG